MASKWRATVASSPRAAGPVRAAAGPQFSHVVDRGPHQIQEGLKGRPGSDGDALGLAEQGHQMVGGHRGGCVVGGPVGVGHGQNPAPEVGHNPESQLVTGHREPAPRPQATSPDGRVGQRGQGMDGGPAGMGVQDLNPQRSGQVSHHRVRVGFD